MGCDFDDADLVLADQTASRRFVDPLFGLGQFRISIELCSLAEQPRVAGVSPSIK